MRHSVKQALSAAGAVAIGAALLLTPQTANAAEHGASSRVEQATTVNPMEYRYIGWFPNYDMCVGRGWSGIRNGEWARFGCPNRNGGYELWVEG